MEIDAAIGPKLFLALAFQAGGIVVFDSIIGCRGIINSLKGGEMVPTFLDLIKSSLNNRAK